MYKFRFGEAARGVTFVPSYLDFGTFIRFYTKKNRQVLAPACSFLARPLSLYSNL